MSVRLTQRENANISNVDYIRDRGRSISVSVYTLYI